MKAFGKPESICGPRRKVFPEGAGKQIQIPQKRAVVATPVPGKQGFVFSPFNNKVIDLVGIPASTLVADPGYPAEEKKYFRVPEIPGAAGDEGAGE